MTITNRPTIVLNRLNAVSYRPSTVFNGTMTVVDRPNVVFHRPCIVFHRPTIVLNRPNVVFIVRQTSTGHTSPAIRWWAIEQVSTFAATLQRHTRQRTKPTFAKRLQVVNINNSNFIGQTSHRVDAQHTTSGLAKVGLEGTHIINSKQFNFSFGSTNKAKQK